MSKTNQNKIEDASVAPPVLQAINRAILESALDCIITMDASGIVREFNPAAERVFGYSRAEAVGQELATLIVPPALRERHRQGLARYLTTGEGPVLGRRIEINALRRDGSEIMVELAITALRIEDAPFFTAYLRDITERVQAERRRTAQYQVASLLAGSRLLGENGSEIIRAIAATSNWVAGSIWLCDHHCETLHCNATWHAGTPALEEFAGVTRAIALQSPTGLPGRVVTANKPTWISDVTQDSNFPRVAAAAKAELRGGFAFPLRAYGEVKGVLELFSPQIAQPDDDLLQMVEALGSQIGLFILRQQIEEQLQREKENAEAANAAKDRFLAMLSHELRTPLTPVLVWAGGMVDEEGLAPDIQQGLRMVCRNIELEARLIDDMLDLTRITRGKLKLQLGPVDLHEILGHALDIVKGDMEDRHLHLDLALDAPHHELNADAPRLQQVFWNIFRNAYKFAPMHGAISVRSKNPTPDKITIEISDNGIGIEPQFLEKIFDAFEQVDTRREGLGLGLAISKAIVEMHGGKIIARSEGLGHGATFVVELPIARSTSAT